MYVGYTILDHRSISLPEIGGRGVGLRVRGEVEES
jgi:hypothetical protein